MGASKGGLASPGLGAGSLLRARLAVRDRPVLATLHDGDEGKGEGNEEGAAPPGEAQPSGAGE